MGGSRLGCRLAEEEERWGGVMGISGILIWRSVSVKACSGSNYERRPLSSVPLQTDESIAHPVTALLGFPTPADR